ncbi:hypothetical protein [Virgibacillus proomii]|jgi:lichenan operon transcriptional antiterminator|uniref:hypothetical protein n=1 Tax=Virgibacillus proomii TaxID=84407 RepID=UPI0009855618|nr:hypothetical protein [Virgibacillus proomii]
MRVALSCLFPYTRWPFGEHLSVVGTTEYYKLKQYDLSGIDFIVSSIPIKDVLPVPVIEVNAILGNQDIRAIRRYVYHDQLNKNIFFTEDLTFLPKSKCWSICATFYMKEI